ncbi:GntR family transcriptional regulator [Zeimonas sediminis]|uniref:GntR family transcriptional regulator n=1 Tax=Zeimonas sediminis TaxID=2944268 RepID=UPI003AF09F99
MPSRPAAAKKGARKSAAARPARTPRTAARPAPAGAAPADLDLLSSGFARPRTLTDEAYERLEELIVTLQLPPGAAISEATLSERLGIGRTPIREALQRLARERLIVILPQRGNLVSQIDVKSQLRLLETRREVERLIARCAARRATPAEMQRFAEIAEGFDRAADENDETSFVRLDKEFNDLCLKAARNEFAAGAMSLMHGLSRRFWYLHYRQAADLPVMARLHAGVAHAIARRDEAAAATALDRLLDNIEQFTRATVSTDA